MEELEIDTADELIEADGPLAYQLSVAILHDALVLSGTVVQSFRFECARCLSPFHRFVQAVLHERAVPLLGEEAAEIHGEFADLTPLLREDILVLLPSHPLCAADCRGIAHAADRAPAPPESLPQDGGTPEVWNVLDRIRPGRGSE